MPAVKSRLLLRLDSGESGGTGGRARPGAARRRRGAGAGWARRSPSWPTKSRCSRHPAQIRSSSHERRFISAIGTWRLRSAEPFAVPRRSCARRHGAGTGPRGHRGARAFRARRRRLWHHHVHGSERRLTKPKIHDFSPSVHHRAIHAFRLPDDPRGCEIIAAEQPDPAHRRVQLFAGPRVRHRAADRDGCRVAAALDGRYARSLHDAAANRRCSSLCDEAWLRSRRERSPR